MCLCHKSDKGTFLYYFELFVVDVAYISAHRKQTFYAIIQIV